MCKNKKVNIYHCDKAVTTTTWDLSSFLTMTAFDSLASVGPVLFNTGPFIFVVHNTICLVWYTEQLYASWMHLTQAVKTTKLLSVTAFVRIRRIWRYCISSALWVDTRCTSPSQVNLSLTLFFIWERGVSVEEFPWSGTSCRTVRVTRAEVWVFCEILPDFDKWAERGDKWTCGPAEMAYL